MTPATASLSTMATSGDGSDPWDWDVDKVVRELCTSDRSWQPRSAGPTLSNPSSLEQALRHHEVSGCVLLEHVDDNVMKDDLGLTVLGRRAFVRSAIIELRRRSAQYQAYQWSHHPENAASEISRGIQDILQRFPAHVSASAVLPGQPQQTFSSVGEPIVGREGNLLQPPRLASDDSPSANRNSSGEYVSTDESTNKRRKLDSLNAEDELEPQFEHHMHNIAEENSTKTVEPHVPADEPATASVEVNDKKRKRIAPTLITSIIDPNRNRVLPTEADNITQQIPQGLEAGDFAIGINGRESLRPVALTPSETIHEARDNSEDSQPWNDVAEPAVSSVEDATSLKSLIVRKRKPASSAKGYLGKGKLPVDDLFYEATAVGHELMQLDDATEFAQLSEGISAGRRLYVHGLMRNFLRAERQVFERNGKIFSALRPYPEKLAPKYQQPSFTLYTTGKDGQIHASRQEVPSWPEIDPNAIINQYKSSIDENKANFNPLGSDMFNSDRLDPSNLEKYKYLEGGDVVLPKYGESDEENEYDLATWKEIEEELGELDRPSKKTKKVLISYDEINEAINEGIAELVEKWTAKARPKREKKAFRLWKKARVQCTKREQIVAAQKDLDHILARITKMRNEILNEMWTSKQQVRKQTRIMELSIFAREDLVFKIAILEQKTAPEKVAHTPSVAGSKKSTHVSDDGEEGESIGSEGEEVSSDDDMDDFVVPDETLPTTEEERHELNLADSENENGEDEEDATMSDASVPNVAGHSPSTPARQIRLKVSKKHKRLVEESHSDVDDYEFLSPPSINNISPPGIKEEEQTLPKLPAPSSTAVAEMIDLTMTSSDDSPAKRVVDLCTPAKKKKPLVRLFNRNSSFSSPITLSDSNNETASNETMPDPENMPPYNNPAAIAKYSFTAWARSFDKERLLIKVFQTMDEEKRAAFFDFIPDISEMDLWGNMAQVIDSLIAGEGSVQGMDTSTREIITGFIRLFVMYIEGRYHPDRVPPKKDKLKKALDQKDPSFGPFYKLCCQMESYFDHGKHYTPTTANRLKPGGFGDDDEDGEPLSATRRRPRDTTHVHCSPQYTITNCQTERARKRYRTLRHPTRSARNLSSRMQRLEI